MKKSLGEKIFDVSNIIILFLLTIIFAFPFWQTLVLSFSDATKISRLSLNIWPIGWSLESYKSVIQSSILWIGYKNTIIRTILGTIISIIITFLAAYVLTKNELPLRNFIMYLVLITLFFSGGLIPSYAVIRILQLRDTIWVLIIPGAFSAWNCIIARNFIQSLPASMEESAVIDGASPFQRVFRIIIPLSMPVIAVLCLWIAVGHWNAWFDAFIYIRKPEKIVLQLVLRRLLMEDRIEDLIRENSLSMSTDVKKTLETVKGATIFVSLIPILLTYPFLQKYFVKGVMIGALKG